MITGVGLVVLGVIGLIMPIMPGWVFLIPGLIILADYFPPIHRLVHWARTRVDAEIKKRTGQGGAAGE
jgi:uncharacterized membrane protein YbaN (DUF454 family)